jgi:CDP-diacylglycerol--glycerol-3-phosphate 3-phosphatidyltransferase
VAKFDLHQWVRARIAPLVAGLDGVGLTPTALTFLGLLLNFGAAWVVWQGELFWGGIAFLLASAFDMLDGALARRQGTVTKLGAFLDSTFDRISEAALFVAILHDMRLHEYALPWLPELTVVVLAGSLTTSYARARAEGLGTECKVGWLERPERIVLLGAGLLLGRVALGYVMFALVPLTWFTVIQRIAHVWPKLDHPPEA